MLVALVTGNIFGGAGNIAGLPTGDTKARPPDGFDAIFAALFMGATAAPQLQPPLTFGKTDGSEADQLLPPDTPLRPQFRSNPASQKPQFSLQMSPTGGGTEPGKLPGSAPISGSASHAYPFQSLAANADQASVLDEQPLSMPVNNPLHERTDTTHPVTTDGLRRTQPLSLHLHGQFNQFNPRECLMKGQGSFQFSSGTICNRRRGSR